jgi:glycosyltransferase involved in cell wall biosynthesis
LEVRSQKPEEMLQAKEDRRVAKENSSSADALTVHRQAAAQPELSIVMPCLNEARTVESCIRKAQFFLKEQDIFGEVIIADNGSTDGSVEIAQKMGARVVNVPVRGYGAALAAGIQAAEGQYVIMGDSDESYDFSALSPFVEKLREGYDLVMGNRYRGGIAPGAMPPMHRYFGNPLLTALGRLFFSCKESGDFYCGLRGFRKDAIEKLGLQSRGMEFALEMVIKAEMHGLRITEVPTTLSPDGRDRAPHLRRYRDGWRSLRFYLLMSPRWFFGIPGLILLVLGLLASTVLLTGPVKVMSVNFDYHSLLYSTAAILLGYQSILLFIFAKLMAVETGLHPLQTKFWFLEKRTTLERFVVAGIALMALGLALGIIAARQWELTGFGNLQPATTIRLVICSVLFLLLGGQTLLAGFFFGLVNLVAERRSMRELSRSAPTQMEADTHE